MTWVYMLIIIIFIWLVFLTLSIREIVQLMLKNKIEGDRSFKYLHELSFKPNQTIPPVKPKEKKHEPL